MKFKYSLPILLCLPVVTFSEPAAGEVTNVSERAASVNSKTNQVDALPQTNDAASAETDVSEVAETNAPAAAEVTEAEPAPEKEPVSVPDLTYFVHQEDTGGCGSAFLFEDDDGVWLVSNVHVFSGSTNLTLKNISRNELTVPAQIEVAKDRDIIRFRVDQPRGLSLSADCDFEEAITAYGDSGGAGVLTRLKGEVVAPGPDRVEISCEIIPGNSGGPVVNAANEVVGVSSYLFRDDLPDWIADGTRFSDTRRMAIRLNDVEWVSADFSDFYKQTIAIETLEEVLDTSIFIAVALTEDPTYTLTLGTDNRWLQSWVKKHNRYAEKESYRNIESNLARLAAMLQHLEDSAASSDTISIPFLQEKIEDILEACAATRKHLEALSKQ